MVPFDPTFSVLIVDPSEAAAPVLKKMLGEIGIAQVESVGTAVDALAHLKANRISLLMTDWVMEPMAGYDLLRAVRADATIAATPIMVVTADASPSQLFEALDEGVDAYALAPFSTRVLAAKLAELQEKS